MTAQPARGAQQAHMTMSAAFCKILSRSRQQGYRSLLTYKQKPSHGQEPRLTKPREGGAQSWSHHYLAGQDWAGLQEPTVTAQLPFLPCQPLRVPPGLPGIPGQKRPPRATNPTGLGNGELEHIPIPSIERKPLPARDPVFHLGHAKSVRFESPDRNKEGSSFA